MTKATQQPIATSTGKKGKIRQKQAFFCVSFLAGQATYTNDMKTKTEYNARKSISNCAAKKISFQRIQRNHLDMDRRREILVSERSLFHKNCDQIQFTKYQNAHNGEQSIMSFEFCEQVAKRTRTKSHEAQIVGKCSGSRNNPFLLLTWSFSQRHFFSPSFFHSKMSQLFSSNQIVFS